LQDVRHEWANLSRRIADGDEVWLYFAGHGTQVPDRVPLDEQDDGMDEALCLADTTAGGDNVLLDDELGSWLDETRASRAIVWIDCCHAGSATKDPGDEIAPRLLPILAGGTSRRSEADWRELRNMTKTFGKECLAFFACQPHQQAYERRFPGQKAPTRSGQFTRFLLDGLRDGRADQDRDGLISASELLSYTRRELDQSFNQFRTVSGDRQEPVLEGTATFVLFPVRVR
jgi:uncharacterized caspase-like protein